MTGKVIGAVKYPISQQEMLRIVNNEELVKQIAEAGPCLQVAVELEPDLNSSNGYHWSSLRGQDLTLYSGSPCEARIIVREQRPLALVLPALGSR
jgi:HlyD family secretion protein